jgi:hypothetical protein
LTTKKLDSLLCAALIDPGSPEIKYIRKRLQDQGVEATLDQLASWLKARLDAKEAPIAQPKLSAVGFPTGGAKVSDGPPAAGYGAIPAGTDPAHWLIPAGNRKGIKSIDYLKMWLARGYWALGERTPGRKAIQPGDRACFYAAGSHQVVAYADVVGKINAPVSPEEWPEPNPQSDVLYKMPLANLTWLKPPTLLDLELRGQLEALAGQNPAGNWGLFFQTSRRLTQQDFKRLTRT